VGELLAHSEKGTAYTEDHPKVIAAMQRHRDAVDERDAMPLEAGRATVQAHVRATWEASQFVLDKAGVERVQTYRAIIRDMKDIGEGNPTEIVTRKEQISTKDVAAWFANGQLSGDGSLPEHAKGFLAGKSVSSSKGFTDAIHEYMTTTPEGKKLYETTLAEMGEFGETEPLVKLPDFKMQRNGAQSTTLDLDGTANTWQGAGGVHLAGPPVNDRVVLRIQTPNESVLSLPCFGQNHHNEQEIVLTGINWQKWDAWQGKAPPIRRTRSERIQALIRYHAERGETMSPESAAHEIDKMLKTFPDEDKGIELE
jgi:hypothetical protein